MSVVARQLRIFPISDLHLEFYKTADALFDKLAPRLPEADVLVLAGDIGYSREYVYGLPQAAHRTNLTRLLTLFKAKYPHVVAICGNHEYYAADNYDRAKCLRDVRQVCEETNVTLLDNSSCEIEGVEFLGTTLWSAIDERTTKSMNDFNYVFRSRIDYLEAFIDCYRWLKGKLAEKTDKPRVVITHHLPTNRLIHPIYADSPINSGFATNILDQLVLRNVKVWCCGHSHMGNSIKYGDTRLVLNPVGYPHERGVVPFSDQVWVV